MPFFTNGMKYTQEKTIIGGGIWLIVLPYTGFPSSWKTVLTLLTGILFTYIGSLQYKRAKEGDHSSRIETKTETFTETV